MRLGLGLGLDAARRVPLSNEQRQTTLWLDFLRRQYLSTNGTTMLGNRALSDIVTFTRASAAWSYSAGGVLVQAAANAPRFDYDPITLAARGLLIEEQRTNLIRNNSMAGAASGSPGTLPTNWIINSAGTTWNVVGTGVEGGIPYIDIRLQGTPSSGTIQIGPENYSVLAAATGQTWALSTFARVAAGSLTNIGSFRLNLDENTSGGAFVFSNTSAALPLTAVQLAQGRLSYSPTLSGGATVGAITPQLRLGLTVGNPIDVTLRIGAPQLETSAFPTSPILTAGAQVTRVPESAAITNLSKINFNATEGTFYAEVEASNASVATAKGILSLDDGTENNRISLTKEISGKLGFASVIGGAGSIILASVANMPAGPVKVAAAYKAGDFAMCLGGATPVTSATGALPAGLNTMRLGTRSNGGAINGWLRNVRYIPRRMTNAELQALTT